MNEPLTTNRILLGDCLDVLRGLPDGCVDLILCSPPYEAARTYGMGFKQRGQDWVDWCVERFIECCRVCRGLVAWVVEGQTRNYRYSAAPALLMADLHRRGVNLRKPPVFHRVGIPGSGGPDWLRNDWEWIICATPKGRLPWSDNTAMGHPPKWAPGGAMSNRHADGRRVNAQLSKRNQWGGTNGTVCRDENGERQKPSRPSHKFMSMTSRGANGQRKIAGGRKMEDMLTDGAEPKVADAIANGMKPGSKLHTKNNGNGMRVQCYDEPAIANPGNIIFCKVGGGLMGSKLAHENEAPYPEKLAEFFVKSFCPPDGIVLDCFCGSGTTLAAAHKNGRRWLGIDVRESQVDLSGRRIEEAKRPHKRNGKPRKAKPDRGQRTLFEEAG